jgi:hypothetical protein
MVTVVRWVKPLKQSLPTLKAAQKYVQTIRQGGGQHRSGTLEIHYNERKHYGRWSVVVVGFKPVPGGSPCVECGTRHYSEDDYLCPSCRETAQL